MPYEHLSATVSQPENIRPISASHMMYEKYTYSLQDSNESLFVKRFNPNLLSEPTKAAHLAQYLEKEGGHYQYLREYGFEYLPAIVTYSSDTLIMSAHLPEDGWLWDAPLEDTVELERYCLLAFTALRALSAIPAMEQPVQITNDHSTSMKSLHLDGFNRLGDADRRAKITQKLVRYMPQLHEHVKDGAALLLELLAQPLSFWEGELLSYVSAPYTKQAHFDARQSNMAYHPEEGLSIVDWSWASPGPELGDSTMLIIDLYKAGVALPEYTRDLFDPQHALLLIGYWLARSVESTPTTDDTVRFHQLASAATAATLLLK